MGDISSKLISRHLRRLVSLASKSVASPQSRFLRRLSLIFSPTISRVCHSTASKTISSRVNFCAFIAASGITISITQQQPAPIGRNAYSHASISRRRFHAASSPASQCEIFSIKPLNGFLYDGLISPMTFRQEKRIPAPPTAISFSVLLLRSLPHSTFRNFNEHAPGGAFIEAKIFLRTSIAEKLHGHAELLPA